MTQLTVGAARLAVLGCWLLLAPAVAYGADRLRLLLDDQDALRTRLLSVERAESDIRLACYEIRPGYASSRLLARLAEQARRGIRVRVLIDGMASAIAADQAEHLLRCGVQIRVYHPLLQRGGTVWLNRRMHSKLLVIDQREMIVGSRNLSDSHFGLKAINHIDYDVLVEGDSCQPAARYFDLIWDSEEVQPLRDGRVWWLNTSRHLRQSAACSIGAEVGSAGEWGPGGEVGGPWLATDSLCLLHDLDPRKDDRHMQRTILSWIDGARSSVVIESPYPVFSTAMLDSLRRASQRGVQISLATNSLCSTDQLSAYAGYRNRKAQLQRWGVCLYEVPGPHHLHAKTLLVDERLTMMGSYNFDSRSERWNLELCLVCRSAEVGQWLRRSVDHRHARSRPITDVGLRGEASVDASPLQKLRLRTAQMVVPVIRPLL
jgi:cardiolipin synthase C